MSKQSYLLFISLAVFATGTMAQAPANLHVLKAFHIGGTGRWDYIAVNVANNRLYVSHETSVNILNATTGDSIGVIENTIGVHGIAFDTALNKGFISDGKMNMVTVFDLTTNKTLQQIPAGNNPDAIMYEPFSKTIIACNGHGNSLSIIDPANNKVITTIALEGNPETAVSNDKGEIYINIENKNEIAVVDIKTFTVEAYWPLTPNEAPAGLAIDKNTDRLFSGCADTKTLVIIDAKNGKLINKFPIGMHCDGLAFDSTTKNIFASNGDGTLTVIHEDAPNDFKIITTVTTKKGARTLAVGATTHLIYLPTADLEQAIPSANSTVATRSKVIPGTFEVLIVGID